MSFMDRAKAAAEKARVKAQEGVGEVQARKDLAQAYWDLGHKTYGLASSGTISHPELDPLVERIRELEARESAFGAGSTQQPEQATDTTPPQTPA